MLFLNLTGLNRFYWWPKVEHQYDRTGLVHGLWYWSFKWLGVEVVAYSTTIAREFIRRLNSDTKREPHEST